MGGEGVPPPPPDPVVWAVLEREAWVRVQRHSHLHRWHVYIMVREYDTTHHFRGRRRQTDRIVHVPPGARLALKECWKPLPTLALTSSLPVFISTPCVPQDKTFCGRLFLFWGIGAKINFLKTGIGCSRTYTDKLTALPCKGKWMNEWINKWMTDWMNEWMNE